MLRSSDEIRFKILKELRKEPINSFFQLTRLIGTSFVTIKNNCIALEKYGFIKIEKIGKENSPSKKDSFKISITDEGVRFLNKIQQRGGEIR